MLIQLELLVSCRDRSFAYLATHLEECNGFDLCDDYRLAVVASKAWAKEAVRIKRRLKARKLRTVET